MKFGADLLDRKCAIQQLSTIKVCWVYSHNSLLAFLDELPPALTILKDCNSTSVRCQDLIPILNTRRNTWSPGINMFLYKFCP